MRSLLIPLLGLLCAAASPGQDPPSAIVRGRVLLADGSPALGAEVRGLARRFSSHNVPSGGVNQPGPVNVNVTANGSYTIELPANEGVLYELLFRLDGHTPKQRVWVGLKPDESKEIDIRMEAACFLVGHLESAAGDLLIEGWAVKGTSMIASLEHEDRVIHSVAVDPATGLFRLGPFPPGKVELQAKSSDKRLTRRLMVEAKAGAEDSVVLRVEDLEPHRALRFRAFNAQYPSIGLDRVASMGGAEPGNGLVLVDREGNAVASATKRISGRDEWEIGPVELGEYSVELRHPAFQPVRLDSVSPGPLYHIDLRGTVAMELEVVDQYGSRLTHYGVLADCGRGVGLASHTFTSIGDPAPAGNRIDGLMPGDVRVVISPPWGRPKSIEVKGLRPGETRKVRIGLLAPGLLQVAVETPGGEPAPGAEVHYTRTDLKQLYTVEEREGRLMHIPKRFAVADELGIARIQHALPDDWTFRVWASPFAYTEWTETHTLGARKPVKLRLPNTGRLEGKLFYQGPFDLTNLCVFVDSAEWEDPYRDMRRGMQDLPWVAADGSFALPGAPIGRVRLEILVGDRGPNPGFRGEPIDSRVLVTNPGTTHVTADLQDTLQASVRVVPLSTGGDALRNVDVFVVERSAAPAGALRGETRAALRELRDSAASEGAGEFVARGLVPLREHHLLLVDKDGGWIADGGPIGGIGPSEEGYAEPLVHPVQGAVIVQDEHGQALSGVEIGWSCRGWTDPRCKGVTDPQGRLDLRLPPGTYGLYRTSQAPRRAATIRWNGRSAEEPTPVVRLQAGS